MSLCRALLPIALLSATACGSSAPTPPTAQPDDPVATWQGGRIERVDFESWRGFHRLEADEEAVREMAFVRSLADAARQRGAEDDVVNHLALESLRQNVLVQALQSQVEDSITVSDEELETLLRENPGAFHRPRKLRLRNIHKAFGTDPAATRQAMADLHAQLLAGADFEALAKAESDSQSSHRGGNLGYLDPEALPTPVTEAVRDLQPGEFTAPVEHGGGVSLFLCVGVRDAKIPSREEVRRKVRNTIHRSRKRATWADLEQSWLDAAQPRIDPTAPVVLAMDSYDLDAKTWSELLALRRRPDGAEEPGVAQQARLLREWAATVLGARQAVDLGLDRRPDVAARLRWKSLDLLAQRELVRRVDERLQEPTEVRLRRHYTQRAGKYRKQKAYDLGVIQIRDQGLTPRQAVEAGQEAVRRLASEEIDFAAAARLYSRHPSAAQGGSMGWLSRRRVASWGPIAIQVVDDLQPGQRSGLLHLESGLWIFELRGKRDAVQLTFEEAREAVRLAVRKQQIRDLERVLRDEELARLENLGLAITAATAPSAD